MLKIGQIYENKVSGNLCRIENIKGGIVYHMNIETGTVIETPEDVFKICCVGEWDTGKPKVAQGGFAI